jgi:succinoglycan biosynthesis protein ExoA
MTRLDPVARPVEAIAAPADLRALVIIPCLNEEAFIGPLLQQILADDGLIDPLIVVADGGSTDRTRAIVSDLAAGHPRVVLMDNPRRLQSAGVNLAARMYGQDRAWLVRVDAHATYPDRYASGLIAEGRRIGAASVVVSMDTVGEPGLQRAIAAAQTSALGTGGSAHRRQGSGGYVDHGHHALFRMAEFLACGGYDETFSHNEDAELDLRLARNGGAIWLTDRCPVVYHPRSTLKALWRQYYAYGRGRARTVLKHRTKLKARQAAPLIVAPAVVLAGLAPLLWPLALPALGWGGACLGYGLLLGVRRRDPWAALVGVPAMTMHLAWSLGAWRQVLTEPHRDRAITAQHSGLAVS